MSEVTVPFLKWAGGKRWLVGRFDEFFSTTSGCHIEPFAGSAAVFFALRPKRSCLSDSNERLIETYKAIRDDVKKFERYFREFGRNHTKSYYYEIRNREYKSPARRAAQFLYLNRVCFNGIYRENLNGKFNVPIGSKKSAFLDSDNFQAVSKLLKNTKLCAQDFEITIDNAEKCDFLYVDPPYTTKHNLNGFVKYNQNIFSWSDQERLAKAVNRAHMRGVKIVVSNADHPDVRELYDEFLEICSVSRRNVIAS